MTISCRTAPKLTRWDFSHWSRSTSSTCAGSRSPVLWISPETPLRRRAPPILGIPSRSTSPRAARSSRTTVAPGLARATVRTAISPVSILPKSMPGCGGHTGTMVSQSRAACSTKPTLGSCLAPLRTSWKTMKGTKTGTSRPGIRRSSSETRARWISGDALTTRIDRLFFLCFELLDACLDRAHVGLTKCIDELDTRQARDFGSLALRDQPLVVPEDRRGETKPAGELLVRSRNREDGTLRDIDRDRLHLVIPPIQHRL